jgi:hypothetical protein
VLEEKYFEICSAYTGRKLEYPSFGSGQYVQQFTLKGTPIYGMTNLVSCDSDAGYDGIIREAEEKAIEEGYMKPKGEKDE